MKVAVINMSGNVGKTMVARQLLAPRMNAAVVQVESINADDETAAPLRGRQFGELLELIAGVDRVVVDVGASNVEDLLEGMKMYRGSGDEFDLYVVPTVNSPKQMRDTITTIAALRERGISADRIRVLFNMVDYRDKVAEVFEPLFDFHRDQGSFKLDEGIVIHQNELFERLAGANVTDLMADQTDLKAMRNAADDPEEKRAITRQMGLRRLAQGVSEEFDTVYKILIA